MKCNVKDCTNKATYHGRGKWCSTHLCKYGLCENKALFLKSNLLVGGKKYCRPHYDRTRGV